MCNSPQKVSETTEANVLSPRLPHSVSLSHTEVCCLQRLRLKPPSQVLRTQGLEGRKPRNLLYSPRSF